jgi:hypothetical protein
MPEGDLPAYLLDREGQNDAKALSSAVKQKRKEKAGKFAVPLPKVRGIAEDEAFKVVKTGKSKRKGWKRMVTKATFVGEVSTNSMARHVALLESSVLTYSCLNRRISRASRRSLSVSSAPPPCVTRRPTSPTVRRNLALGPHHPVQQADHTRCISQLSSRLPSSSPSSASRRTRSRPWYATRPRDATRPISQYRQPSRSAILTLRPVPPLFAVHPTRRYDQGNRHRGERVRARNGHHRRQGRLGKVRSDHQQP